jgi:hypothetical protein
MQTFQERKPAQIHLQVPIGQREDDLIIGKSGGQYSQQPDQEIESPMQILCWVAAAAGDSKYNPSHNPAHM